MSGTIVVPRGGFPIILTLLPQRFSEALMSRQIISTPKAPQAIGAYSQAVRVGTTVYMSGQIPLDPASGEMIQGDMEAQVRRVFENLKAVAEAAGSSLAAAVKLTVFLLDLKHFPVVNQVMADYFREPYPARATVGVAQLPRGAQVEVECILET
jgi:reactive intermediate/imine deaminase